MKKITYLISIVVIMGIAFACSKNEDANPNPDPNQQGSTPGPKFLAVKAVIDMSCAKSGCHVSPTNAGGANFESNANIVDHGAHIKARAVDEGTMPPTGQLSAADKAKISDWIIAGGRLTD
jgi:uncharacterized membrane protein